MVSLTTAATVSLVTPAVPLTLDEAEEGSGAMIPDIEVMLSGIPAGGLERPLTVTLMVNDSIDPLTSKSLGHGFFKKVLLKGRTKVAVCKKGDKLHP